MPVPFMDLTRLVRELAPGALVDFERALLGAELVRGPRVPALERALADRTDAARAVACASGTAALMLALEAAGLRAGDAVAVPDLTFFATFEAVARLGCTPVLVDVDDDLQMCPDELRRAHDRFGVKGAIVVHLFGWASGRLDELRTLTEERGIVLVEDAAQAIGVEVDGAPLLSGARVAALSFHPAKVLGGIMDGGAVLTGDDAIAARATSLRDHGRRGHYEHAEIGWNARMSELQAGYLLHALERLGSILAGRRRALDRYASELPLTRGPARVRGNGYLAVLEVEQPIALAEALGGRGIGTSRIYPRALHEQAPATGALRVSELRRSSELCRRVINLPLFHGITEAELDEVVRALIDLEPFAR